MPRMESAMFVRSGRGSLHDRLPSSFCRRYAASEKNIKNFAASKQQIRASIAHREGPRTGGRSIWMTVDLEQYGGS